MLSILCVGRVIFIHYFYCPLLLLAQFMFLCVGRVFLLLLFTFVSPEKGARCY